MNRQRMFAGLLVVAALAITLIVLSVQGDSPTSLTTTTPVLAAQTTTLPSPTTTTATASTTLTTTAEQRLAEVEVLLGDLWFGWFDAIYRKDPDALWNVVATTQFHEDGVVAMRSMDFITGPERSTTGIGNLRILLDRADCLVVENSVDMTEFRGFVGDSTVSVLWPDSRYGFRFATGWKYANDLWLGDCDMLVRDATP